MARSYEEVRESFLGGNQTKSEKRKKQDEILAKNRPTNSVTDIDDNVINTFIDDIGTFYTESYNLLNDHNYKKGLNAADTYSKRRNEMLAKSSAITAYLKKHKGDYDSDSFEKVLSEISGFKQNSQKYIDALSDVQNFYSSFKDEDEYNVYAGQQKAAKANEEVKQKYAGMTADQIRAERDSVKKENGFDGDSNNKLAFFRFAERFAASQATGYGAEDFRADVKKDVDAIDNVIGSLYTDENGFSVTYDTLIARKEAQEMREKLEHDQNASDMYRTLEKDYEELQKKKTVLDYAEGQQDNSPELYDRALSDYTVAKQKYESDLARFDDRFKAKGYDFEKMLAEDERARDEADYAALKQNMTDFGYEHPVLAAAGSIALSPLRAVETLRDVADNVTGRDYGVTNTWDNIFKNASDNALAGGAEKVEEKTYDLTGSELVSYLSKTAYTGVTSAAQSFVTQALCTAAFGPQLGGAIGMIAMGSGAAADTFVQAARDGKTNFEAYTFAVATGINEAIFERLSFSELKTVERFCSGGLRDFTTAKDIAKSILSMIPRVAASGAFEGMEEVSTTLANTLADYLISGSGSDFSRNVAEYKLMGYSDEEAQDAAMSDWLQGVLDDFIGGMFGGLAGSVGASVRGAAESREANRLEGYDTIGTENYPFWIEQAKALPDTKENAEIKRIANLLEQQDTSTDNGQRRAAELAGRLYNISSDAILENMPSEAQATGQQEEQQTTAADDGLIALAAEKNNVDLSAGNGQTEAQAETQNERQTTVTEDGDLIDTQTGEVIDTAEERRTAEEKAEQEDKPAGGAAVVSDVKKSETSEVAPKGIKQITGISAKGGVSVTLEDGTKAKATEGTVGKETAAVIEGISEVCSRYGLNNGDANFIYNLVKNPSEGQTAADVIDGIERGIRYGILGTTVIPQGDDVYGALTESQKKAAFGIGQKLTDRKAGTEAKRNASLFGTGGRRTGTVKGIGVSIAELKTRFNDKQGTAYKVLSGIARSTGINIVLYSSESNAAGKLVSNAKTAGGAELKGWGLYSRKENTIYLDINAGLSDVRDVNDLTKYTILRSFGHEFVHFLEKNAPAEYNELRRAVFDELAKRGKTAADIDDMIAQQQLMAKNNGDTMTWEAATREVVAEALADILPETSFIQTLANEHKTVARRLYDRLKAFLADLKAQFAGMGRADGLAPNAFRDIDGAIKYTEDIIAKFDKAGIAAVKNYQQIYEYSEAETTDGRYKGPKQRTIFGTETEVTTDETAADMQQEPATTDEKQQISAKNGGGDFGKGDSIKKQVAAATDRLNKLNPIFIINEIKEFSKRDEFLDWVESRISNRNGKVTREGFGDVIIDRKRLKNGFRYLKSNEAKTAFAAVPVVIQKGVEIGNHANHKGRRYSTFTFAAPIIIKGNRGNLTVVVRQENGANYYKVHKLLMPDGSEFILDNEKEDTAERAGAENVPGLSPADNVFNSNNNTSVIESQDYNSERNYGGLTEFIERFDEDGSYDNAKAIRRELSEMEDGELENMFREFPTDTQNKTARLVFNWLKDALNQRGLMLYDESEGGDAAKTQRESTGTDENAAETMKPKKKAPKKAEPKTTVDSEGNTETVVEQSGDVIETVAQDAQTAANEEKKTEKAKDAAKRRVKDIEDGQKAVKTEDFGQKIGGARKDVWTSRGLYKDDLTEMNDAEREKYVEKKNVWKTPDYVQMIKDGTPREVAYAIKQIRDALPVRPENYRVDTIKQFEDYVDVIRYIQEKAMACATREDIENLFDTVYGDYLVRRNGSFGWTDKANTQMKGTWDVVRLLYNYKQNGKFAWNGAIYEANRKQFGVPAEEKLPSGVQVHFSDGQHSKGLAENTWYVTNGYTIIGTGFESREAAVQFVKEKLAKKSGGKTKFVPPQLKQVHRKGLNIRNGNNRHVTGQDYLDEFGFRGGEFGNWLTEKDRSANLDYGYDAFYDLASALGISNADISLGGNLSIAFGARGQGGALAHYEPERTVINLTKLKGAGSLAHEWGHALDNYLAGIEGAKLLTDERAGAINSPALKKLIRDMRERPATEAEKKTAAEKSNSAAKKNAERRTKYITDRLNMYIDYAAKKMTDDKAEAFKAQAKKLVEQAVSGNAQVPDMYWKDSDSGIVNEISDLIKSNGGRVIPKDVRLEYQGQIHRLNEELNSGAAVNENMTVKTDFLTGSEFFDGKSSKENNGYWASTPEMFARAFAGYVNTKLAAKGYFNDYLAGHAFSAFMLDEAGTLVAAFPRGDEAERINADFDALIQEMIDNGMFTARDGEVTDEEFQYQRRVIRNAVEEIGDDITEIQAEESVSDALNVANISTSFPVNHTGTSYDKIGKELLQYNEGTRKPDLTLVDTYNERTGKTERTIKFYGDKPKGYVPKKIAYCYKLFEQHPDGTLHALFAGAKNEAVIGEWIYAKGYPYTDDGVKGMNLRERYGWHLSAGLPSAPHLMSSKSFERGYPSKAAYGHPKGSRRVWVLMAYDATNEYNAIADQTAAGDIFGLIPFGGYYAFKENNHSEWVISSAVKIVKTLSEDERQAILSDAGYDEYEAWRKKHFATDEEKAESKRKSNELKKAKDAAKKAGLNFLSENSQAMRASIRDRIIDNPELTDEDSYDDDDTQAQYRTGTLSDRDVLRYAAENLADKLKTDGQNYALQTFNEKLKKLDDLTIQREQLGKEWHEQQFGSGDKTQAAATLNRMKTLDAMIEQANAEVLSIENKQVLKDVLVEARAVVEQAQRTADAEKIARFKARHEQTMKTRALKESIRSDVEDLVKWTVSPKNKDNIRRMPDVLKGSVIPFLESIDFTSQRALNGGKPTKADAAFAQNLKKLERDLGRAGSADELYGQYVDLPAGFLDRLRAITTAVENITETDGTFYINSMNAQELKDLANTVSILKNVVKNVNRWMGDERTQHVSDAINGTTEYTQTLKDAGTTNRATDYALWQTIRPASAFERFGEGGRAVWNSLVNGQAKLAFNAHVIKDFAEKTFDEKQVKKWTRETVPAVDADGKEFEIPIVNLMSLYLMSQQEDGKRHIIDDGQDSKYHGEGFRVATRTDEKGKKHQDHGHSITSEGLDKLIAMIPKEAKDVADKLQKFMAEQGGEWGNYVSVARWGTQEFTNPLYFPISSDGRQFDVNLTEETPENASLYALLNMSFTKQRNENANNAVLLYNVFDVFANHMSSMAQYNAMALPILDAVRWFNGKNDEGLRLRDELKRVYGTPEETKRAATGYAENFIINIIKSFNGTMATGDNFDSMFLHGLQKFNAAQVAYNFRVVAQQPLSIARAAMVLNAPEILRGFTLANVKNEYADMIEHNGIAAWKDLGFYDVNISRGLTSIIKQDEGALGKAIEFGMAGAEKMDQITWAAIWKACKKKAISQDSSLKPGTEEFYAKVNELFDEVIYKTQVVDSILTKPEVLRRQGLGARMLGSFMSEPLASHTMNIEAIDRYNRDRQQGVSRQEAFRKNGANIARTIAVSSVSSILLSAVTAAFDAARDDDDDEFAEKYWPNFFLNFLDEINPFGKLPGVSQAVDAAKAIFNLLWGIKDDETKPKGIVGNVLDGIYGNEMPSIIKAFEPVINFFNVFAERRSGKSGYTAYAEVYKLLQAVAGITGLPLANATREAVTWWNATVGEMVPRLRVESYLSAQERRDKLYNAILDGDEKFADRLKTQFASESAYNTAIKTALAENDERITEAAQAYLDGDSKLYESIIDEIVSEGHFAQGNVVGAIQSVEKQMTRDELDADPEDWWNYEEGVSDKDLYTSGELKDYYYRARTSGDETEIAHWETFFKSEEDAEEAYRDAIEDRYLNGELTEQEATDALIDAGYGEAKDVFKDYINKWDYGAKHGSKTGYGHAKVFKEAARTGEDYDEIAQNYLDHGFDKYELARYLAEEFKKDYVAADYAGKQRILAQILPLYESIGYDRDYEIRYINENWK